MDIQGSTLPYENAQTDPNKWLKEKVDAASTSDTLKNQLVFNPLNGFLSTSKEHTLSKLQESNKDIGTIWHKVSSLKAMIFRMIEERKEKNKLIDDPGKLY